MTVAVVTFGCRLNLSESEAMRVQAEAAGQTDLAIVNTCAVTAEATRQAGQAIRRLARERPDRPIVATGCAAQIEPARFAAMPEVARVLGNHRKLDPESWRADFTAPGERVLVDDIMAATASPHPRLDGMQGHTRAFVPVQNGCDHRCTFCVIPFGRGQSRSVPLAEVIAQVELLVGNGTREIVLTGVDITSYGRDLAGAPPLGRLVRAILAAVPGLERLRLSSIDSVEADAELFEALAGEPRLMPHLHLSLQSGDDLILKRMKRRHSRQEAIAFCAEVRRLRPEIVFGADLIAGFPTESEAMFQHSLDLVAECGLTHLHVFPYSARPGTPAARMPALPGPVVAERAGRLRARGTAALVGYLDTEIGTRQPVLTERGNVARTERFTLVRLAEPCLAGQIVEARITGHDGRALLAA